MSNPPSARISIIGIGNDGLAGAPARARDLLESADLLIGPDAVRNLLPGLKAEWLPLGHDLQGVVERLRAEHGRRRVAVVAGGDPLFYGVARYLCDRLGKDAFEVVPHVSSMQLAFARIKETWEEAYLTDLSVRPLADVLDRIRTAPTVGLFTSPEYQPPRIARELRERGINWFRVYVCENLGGPDERITQGELTDIEGLAFDPLNVMILLRKPGVAEDRPAAALARFGNPDEVFAKDLPQSNLMTRSEVRALALAQLDLKPADLVWDVGAGTGSVAIEAGQLVTAGRVFAIEEDASDYQILTRNVTAFAATNVQPVFGTAPAVFESLPAPDAVFVGGTGKEMVQLLEATFAALRPGGRLVANVATLESLSAEYAALKRLAPPVGVLLVSVARGVEQLETLRFEAVPPSFLLRVVKAQA